MLVTKRDQFKLIDGYIRENYDCPVEITNLITDFFVIIFIWRQPTSLLQSNEICVNDYILRWERNVLKASNSLIILSKPKKVISITIYYELSCKQSEFTWNGVAKLDPHHATPLADCCYTESLNADILYIKILKETHRRLRDTKMAKGVTMNAKDKYEWIIHQKEAYESDWDSFKKEYQICSPTFGKSRNWYLSLEHIKSNGVDWDWRLYLNVLLFPSSDSDNSIKSVKCMRVSLNSCVTVKGMEKQYMDSFCSRFEYGDKTYLWKSDCLDYVDQLRVVLELDVLKVYASDGKVVPYDRWNEYRIF